MFAPDFIHRSRNLFKAFRRQGGAAPEFRKSRSQCLEWAASAFAGLGSTEGPSAIVEFRNSVAADARNLARLYQKCWVKPGQNRDLIQYLITSCEKVMAGHLRVPGMKLRSYSDASVAAYILRRLIEFLPVDPLEVAVLLAAQVPNARAAHIVHAELLLERGEIEAAIGAARKALAIESTCMTAQHLLFRAWKEKTKQGSNEACVEIALDDLSDRFCNKPFTTLSTTPIGHTWLCDCGAWLPYSAGGLFAADSAAAVWNSEAAMEIRRSILDGSFRYCSRMLCSHLVSNCLPRKSEISDDRMRHYLKHGLTRLTEAPRFVQLSHDSTCNLACPSCRPQIIAANASQQQKLNQALERVVLPLLRRVQGEACVTGWGDPFTSKHYLALLARLNPKEFPGLQLDVVTNGVRLTRHQWEQLGPVREMICRLKVSIDAATAETYEKIRPPARWSQLMANLEFLSTLRANGQLKQLWICFVVQKANFREILDFIRLGQRLKVDRVYFLKLWNLSGLTAATFADMDVASPSHPWHAELREIMKDPLLREPMVLASNLQLMVDHAAS